jgi:acyl-homoserine lactone acylase PvdQ
MELWKRAGQGRLAEIVGPGALQRYVNARLVSYRGDMESEFESYSPDTRESLEASTDGINAYIARRAALEAVDFRSNFKLLAFNLSRGSRPTAKPDGYFLHDR